MSKERLPFSIAYLSSLGLTLYFALGVRHIYQTSSYAGHADGWFLASFIFWVSDRCRDSSHRTCLIRSSLFSRRHTNITLWRPDGAPRCWIPAPRLTCLTSLHLYPALIVPLANITHCETCLSLSKPGCEAELAIMLRGMHRIRLERQRR